MLRAVTLVGAWRRIESELPRGWTEARLHLTVDDEGRAARAAALLGPAAPGRSGRDVRFHCVRGTAVGPDALFRLLERLDAEQIQGRLELVSSGEAAVRADPVPATLRGAWEAELGALPPDWSDVYAEVELTSTDYLERAALLLSAVNPSRYGGATGFRFRCSKSFGYGATPQMAGRCLQRLDDEQIRGAVRVLQALSDTHPVGTQGPVFRLGGKAV
jgi:hypothetical protein